MPIAIANFYFFLINWTFVSCLFAVIATMNGTDSEKTLCLPQKAINPSGIPHVPNLLFDEILRKRPQLFLQQLILGQGTRFTFLG